MLDPDGLPLALLREADGTPCQVRVALPGGRQLVAHVWRAQVGRVPLLLLDSDVQANDEAARGITDRLYGGSGEHRLQQEMLLGIGGVRALRLWSRLTGAPAPDVYHCNEGHAGFLGLERIRELVQAEQLDLRRGARGRPGRHGLHHAHTRCRPASTGSAPTRSRPTSAATARCPASRSTGSWRSAPRTTPAASPASSTWP